MISSEQVQFCELKEDFGQHKKGDRFEFHFGNTYRDPRRTFVVDTHSGAMVFWEEDFMKLFFTEGIVEI